MSFFFLGNDERKNDNSKNINGTAFREQSSLTLFSKLYYNTNYCNINLSIT